jgi:D-3-phosphoglycerate dehydrogenase
MKRTIIRTEPLHQEGFDLLTKQCEILKVSSGAEGIELARKSGAVAAIIGSTWQFNGAVMDQIPSLLIVARPGIGVDNVDLPAATERGVVVVNTPEAPTVSTAEQTVSLLLALAKRHKPATRLLATQGDKFAEPLLIEVQGKVLGLVGLGRIGGTVAHICGQGLGMKVIAFDPLVSPERATSLGVTLYPSMYDVLRAADFVSLHLPLTKETRHTINAEALAVMKPTAFLLNCARGPIVDEAALIAALQAGKLAGAGLDVFDPEPPSPSNPLLHMENVEATPHSSGFSDGCQRKMGLALAEEILDALNGKRPANVVNPKVWDSPARHRRFGAS